MESERIKTLLQFLREDPHDPFTLYALALEYAASGDNDAGRYFDQLLQEHPDYLPTYYHAAHYFAALEQSEKALNIFQKGIELARNQGDEKAGAELRNAYQNLMYED